jgi:hypothetical protein
MSLKLKDTSSMFDQHCQLVVDFIKTNRDQNTSPIFHTLKNRFYAAFILKKSLFKQSTKRIFTIEIS